MYKKEYYPLIRPLVHRRRVVDLLFKNTKWIMGLFSLISVVKHTLMILMFVNLAIMIASFAALYETAYKKGSWLSGTWLASFSENYGLIITLGIIILLFLNHFLLRKFIMKTIIRLDKLHHKIKAILERDEHIYDERLKYLNQKL